MKSILVPLLIVSITFSASAQYFYSSYEPSIAQMPYGTQITNMEPISYDFLPTNYDTGSYVSPSSTNTESSESSEASPETSENSAESSSATSGNSGETTVFPDASEISGVIIDISGEIAYSGGSMFPQNSAANYIPSTASNALPYANTAGGYYVYPSNTVQPSETTEYTPSETTESTPSETTESTPSNSSCETTEYTPRNTTKYMPSNNETEKTESSSVPEKSEATEETSEATPKTSEKTNATASNETGEWSTETSNKNPVKTQAKYYVIPSS